MRNMCKNIRGYVAYLSSSDMQPLWVAENDLRIRIFPLCGKERQFVEDSFCLEFDK